jgi:hypothetical protein
MRGVGGGSGRAIDVGTGTVEDGTSRVFGIFSTCVGEVDADADAVIVAGWSTEREAGLGTRFSAGGRGPDSGDDEAFAAGDPSGSGRLSEGPGVAAEAC